MQTRPLRNDMGKLQVNLNLALGVTFGYEEFQITRRLTVYPNNFYVPGVFRDFKTNRLHPTPSP